MLAGLTAVNATKAIKEAKDARRLSLIFLKLCIKIYTCGEPYQ
jgi:hypothetical protein